MPSKDLIKRLRGMHNEPVFKKEKENNGKLNLPPAFPSPCWGLWCETEISQRGHLSSHLGPRPSQSGVGPTTLCGTYLVRWFHSPQAQARVSPWLRMGWRWRGGGQLLAEAPGRRWVSQQRCASSLLCPLPCTHELCPQPALSLFP